MGIYNLSHHNIILGIIYIYAELKIIMFCIYNIDNIINEKMDNFQVIYLCIIKIMFKQLYLKIHQLLTIFIICNILISFIINKMIHL